jgi:hypothetical protein
MTHRRMIENNALPILFRMCSSPIVVHHNAR